MVAVMELFSFCWAAGLALLTAGFLFFAALRDLFGNKRASPEPGCKQRGENDSQALPSHRVSAFLVALPAFYSKQEGEVKRLASALHAPFS